MNNDLVEIACIVDRSGSMGAITSDAIGGFNVFLAAQKAEPGSARFTLVLFDHEYEVVHEGVSINDVRDLTAHTYQPRGTTALLDAVGRTIDAIGARLAKTPEADRPHKVIVAILTDGMENASCDYTYEKVAQMIEHQRNVYGWEFVFLAANQDAIASAGKLSIAANDAINFQATGEGVRHAYAAMSSTVSERRGRRG
jgi:uncharacterized protein YegL